jgi:hypothetical protein
MTNEWSKFLDARMELIKAAIRSGKTQNEIADMIGVSGIQALMLYNSAQHMLAEE